MNKEKLQLELVQKLRKPYGQYYDDNKNLEKKQIAKNIRKELKALTKLGFKFSVRTEWGTLSATIRVNVLAIPEDWIIYNPYYDNQKAWEINVGRVTSWETGKDPREVYTELGKVFGSMLRTLCNQWNYDNSDSYTDYYENNYFLQVSGPNGSMMN